MAADIALVNYCRPAILRWIVCCLLIVMMHVSTAAEQQNATLNLKDADINTLIATVGQITGKNFVVDPRVKGKVTVISSTPMSAAGIYQTFLSILQVHGYAAVPSGRVTEIVPEVNAKQQGGVPTGGKGIPGEEIVTRVVRVSNVPASQLVPILRPLVPQYGHLAAYAPANMLIISDRASNVQRLVKIIQRMDNEGRHHTAVVTLNNASAADVVTTLSQIIQQAGKGNGPAATAIPDERTNSVLLSGDSQQIASLKRVIATLDQPVNQNQSNTQVIYLHYADAVKLAKILGNYIKGSVEQNNNGGNKNVPAPEGGAANGVTIVPAKSVNAVVVTAPPQPMRSIKAIIAQLDIRRAQVLVQAIIAEVSANTSRELGIDWAAFNGDRIAAASLPGVDQTALQNLASNLNNTSGALLGLLKPGGITAAAGKISENGTSFALLLRALSSNADTNILSTPTVVTMDNQPAEISVGQQVPFLTGSYATAGTGGGVGAVGGGVNPFQTIQRQQVGLTLKLKPQINQGNAVQLTIDQEVSSLSNDASSVNAVDVITNNRTLKTTVSVQNGDVLVLGGLIDNNVRTTERDVPLLSSIPLVGSLFRFRSYDRDKRNLMIFIRPVILRDNKTANYFTHQKYQSMRNVQLETRKNAGSTLATHALPVMPPYEQFQIRLPETTHKANEQGQPWGGKGGAFAR